MKPTNIKKTQQIAAYAYGAFARDPGALWKQASEGNPVAGFILQSICQGIKFQAGDSATAQNLGLDELANCAAHNLELAIATLETVKAELERASNMSPDAIERTYPVTALDLAGGDHTMPLRNPAQAQLEALVSNALVEGGFPPFYSPGDTPGAEWTAAVYELVQNTPIAADSDAAVLRAAVRTICEEMARAGNDLAEEAATTLESWASRLSAADLQEFKLPLSALRNASMELNKERGLVPRNGLYRVKGFRKIGDSIFAEMAFVLASGRPSRNASLQILMPIERLDPHSRFQRKLG
jgi:hypothetical protein